MNLRPDEITGIIKEQIKNYSSKLELKDIGTVVTVGDGIATVHGLENCMSGELLEFEGGIYGMALNLEQDFVGAWLCWVPTPQLKKVIPLKGLIESYQFL